MSLVASINDLEQWIRGEFTVLNTELEERSTTSVRRRSFSTAALMLTR